MANEIKPGEVAWIRIREKDQGDGFVITSEALDARIPDHRALPAIAKLLTTHGDAVHSALWSAIDCYSNSVNCDIDKEQILNELSAALGASE